MDALILAAGYGTRLRPLTDRLPKVLVEVAGEPVLVRTTRYLASAGVDRVVINTHHLADQIERFTSQRDLGVEVTLSHEPGAPLGTGGGLYHARSLLRRDRPFLIMIGDIITDADLASIVASHDDATTLVSLAVHERQTSRRLRFDDLGLYGRVDERSGEVQQARAPIGQAIELAFAGIHVVSPRIFELIDERGVFPILPMYLRLAAEGHRIAPVDVTGAMWLEIGSHERLQRAGLHLSRIEGGPDPRE